MIATLPAGRRTRPAGRRLDVLGHPVRITGVHDGGRAAALLGERSRTFAAFLSTSEVTRLNRSERSRVELSPLLAETVAASLAAAAATDGLVSPVRGPDRDQAWRHLRLLGRVLERPVGVVLELTDAVLARAADDVVELLEGQGTVVVDRFVGARGLGEAPLPSGGSVRFGAGPEVRYGLAERQAATGTWRAITVVADSAFDAFVAAEAAAARGPAGFDWLEERGLPARLRGAARLERRTRAWAERARCGSAR